MVSKQKPSVRGNHGAIEALRHDQQLNRRASAIALVTALVTAITVLLSTFVVGLSESSANLSQAIQATEQALERTRARADLLRSELEAMNPDDSGTARKHSELRRLCQRACELEEKLDGLIDRLHFERGADLAMATSGATAARHVGFSPSLRTRSVTSVDRRVRTRPPTQGPRTGKLARSDRPAAASTNDVTELTTWAAPTPAKVECTTCAPSSADRLGPFVCAEDREVSVWLSTRGNLVEVDFRTRSGASELVRRSTVTKLADSGTAASGMGATAKPVPGLTWGDVGCSHELELNTVP